MSKDSDAVRNWWRTSIIDMEPGRIAFRGHPIEDLVGNAASELQDLLAGLSVSVKQILKIMSKVLGETADYLVLISEDLMESASLCLDHILSSDDESLMALSALCA